MRARAALPYLGLAALVAASALVVVGVGALRDEKDGGLPPLGVAGARVEARLLPRIVLFGDTVRAVVDVTLDNGRFDPDSVRVSSEFSPWETVGRAERSRRDSGRLSHVQTTFVLRCMKSPCTPSGQSAPLELSAGRVTFARLAGPDAGRESLAVEWPLLVVFSRFAAVGFEDAQTASTPWRADLVSLPAVSYRASPAVLVAVLLAAAVLLAGAGAALVYVAWPRRAPEPEPEPEPEPLPSLSPLEQALALLEESVRTDGASDQRRALELVAEELEEWGDDDLAGRARVLAWSPHVPEVEETNALAARVREELDQALLERAELSRNGGGHDADA